MPVTRGICVKPGDEIWHIQGRLLRIGVITEISEARQTVTLEGKDGKTILKPEESLLFKKPEKPLKKK